jgi:TPR repeat protein
LFYYLTRPYHSVRSIKGCRLQGVMYDNGQGVTQDYKTAVKWHTLAAELTTGLFEALEANPQMDRAEALQSSMMSLASDSENPHYSHPTFWVPFSLIVEGAALN